MFRNLARKTQMVGVMLSGVLTGQLLENFSTHETGTWRKGQAQQFLSSGAPTHGLSISLCLLTAWEQSSERNWKGRAAAAAKSLQLCPILWDPIDGSPPGSPVPGILQARTLEWVAISFSIAWRWKVKVKSLSRVRLLATPWTAAYQAPPSMGFSRREYWSGAPLPSPIGSAWQAKRQEN